jgi:hypothetical protein
MTWWLLEAGETLRSFRSRLPLVAFGAALLTAWLATLLELRASPAYALERALIGPVYGLLLPLCCVLATRLAFAEGLDASLPRTSFGVDRRLLLSGRILALFLIQCVFALLLTATTALTARNQSLDPRELLVASLLGALAYGAVFVAGTSVGQKAPFVLMGADWLLGSGEGPLALPFPRGHLRNLVGGTPVLDLGSLGAAGCLLGVAALAVTGAVLRTRR